MSTILIALIYFLCALGVFLRHSVEFPKMAWSAHVLAGLIWPYYLGDIICREVAKGE